MLARRALEQLVEGLALVLAEAAEDVVLDRGERRLRAGELGLAGRSDLDDVAAAVRG